jgi:orotidine 5'-phosphate decarboxylase subfamily 2
MAAVRTCLCLGLDPDPAGFPRGFGADARGAERFARLLLEAAAPLAAAVKPNLAYWEAFGSEGLAALERVRAAIPADVPLIADAKRGDIAPTSARHAAALFDHLGADAVTASPYLGEEALRPLLEREDRFVYVLCRTSNPGAAEFQDLALAGDGEAGRLLHLQVALRAGAWSERHRTVGLVVGATAPEELAAVRTAVPQLPFLVPGIGAQGGTVETVLREGPARTGAASRLPAGSLLVNVGRGIAEAALEPGDPLERLAARAADWAGRLPVLR